jgi:hypothetical protein
MNGIDGGGIEMRDKRSWIGLVATLVAVACVWAIVPTTPAQSKKSAKQAESLEKSGESAKKAVEDVLVSLGGLLTGYNAIIDGDTTDTQGAYKKLVGDLKGTEKKIEGARKELSGLKKEADKFFKAWEADLASMSSESMREKSAARMEIAQQRYAAIGETLGKARKELAPVVQNLNDQVLYLGRDLSPDAIADLQDEAAALNQQAADATAKVKALLQSAGKAQEEAEAEIEEEDA